MYILATGDRNWPLGLNPVRTILVKYTRPGDIIIEGECRGIDLMVKHIAKYELGLEVKEYPAEWEKYKHLTLVGRKNPAGPIRNKKMLDENPTIQLVLAFHTNIFQSKGTKNMISQARKKDITVVLYDGKSEEVMGGPLSTRFL